MSRSHIYTHCAVICFGPGQCVAEKVTGRLCRVHKCKPYNPIKEGSVYDIGSSGCVPVVLLVLTIPICVLAYNKNYSMIP